MEDILNDIIYSHLDFQSSWTSCSEDNTSPMGLHWALKGLIYVKRLASCPALRKDSVNILSPPPLAQIGTFPTYAIITCAASQSLWQAFQPHAGGLNYSFFHLSRHLSIKNIHLLRGKRNQGWRLSLSPCLWSPMQLGAFTKVYLGSCNCLMLKLRSQDAYFIEAQIPGNNLYLNY